MISVWQGRKYTSGCNPKLSWLFSSRIISAAVCSFWTDRYSEFCHVAKKGTEIIILLDSYPMEGPMKSLVPVCMSVCQLSIFSQELVIIFFLIFCAMVNDWTFINWQRPFSRKNHFCLNLGKKHPKWPQNRVLDTLKSFVISFSWK